MEKKWAAENGIELFSPLKTLPRNNTLVQESRLHFIREGPIREKVFVDRSCLLFLSLSRERLILTRDIQELIVSFSASW